MAKMTYIKKNPECRPQIFFNMAIFRHVLTYDNTTLREAEFTRLIEVYSKCSVQFGSVFLFDSVFCYFVLFIILIN